MKKIFLTMIAVAAFAATSFAQCVYPTDNVTIKFKRKIPGALMNGEFSVSSSKKVYFSQGNLQYIGSAVTPYWKFADYQYETLGTTSNQNSSDSNKDRDLFGWATSGWNNSSRNAYQPWATSNNNNDYGVTNPKSNTEALTGDYANGDWGYYNAISNGGNATHTWRTLTGEEWVWLIGPHTTAANPGTNCRTSSTINGVENARFTKAILFGTTKGVIIFPDEYIGGTPSGVSWGTINGFNNDFTTTCDSDGWAALEAAGCVFLPAAGAREGTTVSNVGTYGFYWSSTSGTNVNVGEDIRFYATFFGAKNDCYRYRGCSVRLVQDVE